RVAVLVDVPGKDRQMHTMGEGVIDGVMHRAREVQQTAIQPRGGIQPAIIFHAKMHIRQMQQPQRHARLSLLSPRLLGEVVLKPCRATEDYADGRLWCQLICYTAVSDRPMVWPSVESEDPVSSHGLAVFQVIQVLDKACIKSLRTGIHRIVRGVLDGHQM